MIGRTLHPRGGGRGRETTDDASLRGAHAVRTNTLEFAPKPPRHSSEDLAVRPAAEHGSVGLDAVEEHEAVEVIDLVQQRPSLEGIGGDLHH